MSREIPSSEIRKKLKGYQYQDMATSDVYSLHKNFKTLKPQDAQPYVHPNGNKENCVAVTGTIPIKIRGQQYNIPVSLWLRPSHPYISPIVYVTPTSDMGIQQSRFVDTNGKVYLPYISEWKQGSSDLSSLVQVMRATFAENCPVYSKARPPPPTSSYAPQPPPQGGSYGRQPYTASVPYPVPQQQRPPYGQQFAPYPAGPRGPVGMPTPGSQGNYRPPPATGAYYPTTTAPYPTPSTSYQPRPPPPSHHHHRPQHAPPPSTYYQPQGPVAAARGSVVAAAAGVVAASAQISAADERKHIEEQELIKRQSLVTAVEDKIRRQVKQVLDAAQDEMDSMLQTMEELKLGNQKVNGMVQEMENKQNEVDGSIDILRSKNAELESMLDYLRAQPDKIDVDEAISATNPLYNQILQLYAEENAIDDTIYYLGEALRKGVIELEVFLKHVRELSRQQFMARALIMKARSSAGLPDYGSV